MYCSLTNYRNSSFVGLTGGGTCNRPKAFIFPSMHKPSLGQTGQHSSPAWGTHLGEGLKPGWTFPLLLEDALLEQESPLVQRLLLSACQGMAGNQCRLQVSPAPYFPADASSVCGFLLHQAMCRSPVIIPKSFSGRLHALSLFSIYYVFCRLWCETLPLAIFQINVVQRAHFPKLYKSACAGHLSLSIV